MNNKDCQKGTLTTFLDQYKEDNKNPNLVKPEDWNLISAFKFRKNKWEYVIVVLAVIYFLAIMYLGYNFVYQKYMPITESLSVLAPR